LHLIKGDLLCQQKKLSQKNKLLKYLQGGAMGHMDDEPDSPPQTQFPGLSRIIM